MRYTFGARIPSKDGQIVEGLYIFNDYGLASIIPFNEETATKLKKTSRMLVADNLEDAQEYVKHLSKCYHKEFHDRAKRENLNISDFRFYLIKLDSSKFKGIKFKDSKSRMKKQFSYIKVFDFEVEENKR